MVSRPNERDAILDRPRLRIEGSALPAVTVVVDEVFAGSALLSRELHTHSAATNTAGVVYVQRGLVEKDTLDQRLLRRIFPDAMICCDYYNKSWQSWPPADGLSILLGCPPCRIVAPPGKQRCLDDPDAEVSTIALGAIATHHRHAWIVGEQHAQIALHAEGAVLRAQDDSLSGYVRKNVVAGAPLGAELAGGAGRPTTRSRLSFLYERSDLDLGPVRPLEGLDHGGAIADVLQPSLTPEERALVILPGVLTPVPHELPARGRMVVVARLAWGSHDGVVVPGSKVLFRQGTDGRPFIVTAMFGDRAKLFYDDNRDPEYLKQLVHVSSLITAPRSFDVLHTDGVYGSLTRFGTPPLYGQKQLIMRNGEPSLFTTWELYNLHNDLEHLSALRGLQPSPAEVDVRGQLGKSLVRDFARKIVARLTERVQLAVDVQRGVLQPHSQRPEHGVLSSMYPWHSVGTALVFVNLAAAPTLLTSPQQLLVRVSDVILERKAAKDASTALASQLFSAALGFEPDAFVAGTSFCGDHPVLVTVCPIVLDTRYVFDSVAWCELHELDDHHAIAVYKLAVATSIANLGVPQGALSLLSLSSIQLQPLACCAAPSSSPPWLASSLPPPDPHAMYGVAGIGPQRSGRDCGPPPQRA